MNTMKSLKGSTKQAGSWRRAVAALGAALAIGIGGIGMISPAEAHVAGVSQPLVIQTSTVQVATTPATGSEDND